MARRRCRNCPDEPKPEPLPLKTVTVVAADEGVKLWHQSVFACNSVLDMMLGYATLGVPGTPGRQLRTLAAKIDEIIHTCEKRDASSNSVE